MAILRDDLGLLGQKDPAEDLQNIAGEIQTALSIRTVSLGFDELKEMEPGRVGLERAGSMRCFYALRFGQERDEEQEGKNRPDQVRRAFNSPFRPFVLATTSIGQEGLDFHQYAMIHHWNLPANPADPGSGRGGCIATRGTPSAEILPKSMGLRRWLTVLEPSRILEYFFQMAVGVGR